LLIFFGAFLVIDSSPRRSPSPWSAAGRKPEKMPGAQPGVAAALRLSPGLSLVLFRTLKRAIQGKPFAWDKLDRTAAVNYVPAEKRDSVKV